MEDKISILRSNLKVYKVRHRDIGAKTGYTRNYVYQVLSGRRNNQKIIDAALDLLDAAKEREKKRAIRLRELAA